MNERDNKIIKYYNVVFSVYEKKIKPYHADLIEKENFISHGFEGLIYAADNFNTNKNQDFFLYAFKCIKWRMQSYLKKLIENNKVAKLISLDKLKENHSNIDFIDRRVDLDRFIYIDKHNKFVDKINKVVRQYCKPIEKFIFFHHYEKCMTNDEIAAELKKSKQYIINHHTNLKKRIRLYLKDEFKLFCKN